MHTMEPR